MRTRGGVLAVVLLLSSCKLMLPAPVPMHSLRYDATTGPARCLFVLLPGMGDHDVEYERQGFIAAARRRGLSLDLVSADATYGYYAGRTLLDRLREDVVRPARARGYREVWLAGISMGGMGALLYASTQREKIDGVLLLAPYLGSPEMIDEVAAWGGLARWKPGPPAARDYQRELWRYLKNVIVRGRPGPALFLGAGDKDKLRLGHQLLAEAMPADHVSSTPGGHDWGPWNVLWERFLDGPTMQSRCALGPAEGGASDP